MGIEIISKEHAENIVSGLNNQLKHADQVMINDREYVGIIQFIPNIVNGHYLSDVTWDMGHRKGNCLVDDIVFFFNNK